MFPVCLEFRVGYSVCLIWIIGFGGFWCLVGGLGLCGFWLWVFVSLGGFCS